LAILEVRRGYCAPRRPYEEPRLWTRPLRELTPETSLGFEVIEFARDILGVELYPWQKWLLIHALELLEDGTYRFKRVIVLVARQQGKTLLASVLAAWWLYVDSARHPDRIASGQVQDRRRRPEPRHRSSAVVDGEAVVGPEAGDGGGRGAGAPESLQDATSRCRHERRPADHRPVTRPLRDPRREERAWEACRAGPDGRDA
jgi:hypothetical protein